jgi:hypothetical protein
MGVDGFSLESFLLILFYIFKKRMDPFEDTTGNNVGTLSHHHHQN